ncbi:MAG: RND family efflux transporter MFP subunit, partial [Halothiobacillaceae bacterium]
DNTLSLPPEALYGIDRIYKIVDERLVAVSVTRIGEEVDGAGGERIVVASGAIKEGDLILTTKFANAMAGVRVGLTGTP